MFWNLMFKLKVKSQLGQNKWTTLYNTYIKITFSICNKVNNKSLWNIYAWLSSSSLTFIPPGNKIVAVSGTVNTFHPRFSKKEARRSYLLNNLNYTNKFGFTNPVVLPLQGPPVNTNLKVRNSFIRNQHFLNI